MVSWQFLPSFRSHADKDRYLAEKEAYDLAVSRGTVRRKAKKGSIAALILHTPYEWQVRACALESFPGNVVDTNVGFGGKGGRGGGCLDEAMLTSRDAYRHCLEALMARPEMLITNAHAHAHTHA